MLVGIVVAVPAFFAARWLSRHIWRIVAFFGGWIVGLATGVVLAFAVPSLVDVGAVGVWMFGMFRIGIVAGAVGALAGAWRRAAHPA